MRTNHWVLYIGVIEELDIPKSAAILIHKLFTTNILYVLCNI